MPKTLEQFEPGRNKPCPCGSGIKFKKCCKGGYKNAVNSQAVLKYNQGLYNDALIACRLHLCWYILSHKAHTVPFLDSGKPEALALLKIDIEALAALVDLLYACYRNTGRSSEFSSTLDNLASVVNDLRWNDKIQYFRAIWNLVEKDDRETAFSNISNVDIAASTDPEILTLYLDVCPDRHSFDDEINIIDRICDNTNKPSYRLQYLCMKGLTYCRICEIEKGCEIIEVAIDEYKKTDNESKSLYGNYQFAYALHMLGGFRKSDELMIESIEAFEKHLQECRKAGCFNEHLSDLLLAIGNCQSFLGDHHSAILNYTESLELNPQELTRIFLAKAQIYVEKSDEARTSLESISHGQLSEANFYDYAVSWAILGLSTLRTVDLEKAKTQLKQTKSNDPLFIQQRDALMIALLEASPKPKLGKIRSLLRSINRYVSLNPNVFGLGINMNKIFEDIS